MTFQQPSSPVASCRLSATSQAKLFNALPPDTLPANLPLRHVLALTTWCRSTLYSRMKDPQQPFPSPVRLGPRRVVWPRDEVLAYIAARVVQRDAAAGKRADEQVRSDSRAT